MTFSSYDIFIIFLCIFFSLPTRILKKKKLKINVHRPIGTRVKYDDDGNQVAPLAAFAAIESADTVLEPEKGPSPSFPFTLSYKNISHVQFKVYKPESILI